MCILHVQQLDYKTKTITILYVSIFNSLVFHNNFKFIGVHIMVMWITFCKKIICKYFFNVFEINEIYKKILCHIFLYFIIIVSKL